MILFHQRLGLRLCWALLDCERGLASLETWRIPFKRAKSNIRPPLLNARRNDNGKQSKSVAAFVEDLWEKKRLNQYSHKRTLNLDNISCLAAYF